MGPKQLIQKMIQNGGFNEWLLKHVLFILLLFLTRFKWVILETCPTQGRVLSEFTVAQEHLNTYKTCHGGIICSLMDIAGSLAVAVKRQSLDTGVSAELSTRFISSAQLGDVLQYVVDAFIFRIESICHKAGKYLAFTETIIRKGDKMIATGSHTKFTGLPSKL